MIPRPVDKGIVFVEEVVLVLFQPIGDKTVAGH